jgi:60 kDa SS-A/Ro ribonucleoprotein
MLWAIQNKVEADTFVIYTDNETWAGQMHPVQALQRYRKTFGIPARLIVVGMTSTGFSIADPNDPGMLDLVGFDTSAPEAIRAFSAGEV